MKKQLQMKRDTLKGGLTVWDGVAVILGVLLFGYLWLCARQSIGVPDEAFYLDLPQRFAQGDKLLVHEWGIEQLFSLFLWIPYRLFVLVTGGTQGILLAFRRLYVCVDTLFYGYVYYKLRDKKLAGILCAFLFCAVVPALGPALNYYTISLMAILQFLLLLFTGPQKKRKGTYVLGGVIWAFGILAEPLLIFTYLAYCAVFPVLKKKKIGEEVVLFQKEAFLFISLGGWLTFCVFMLMLYATGSLAMLPKTIPYLVNDVGYSPSDIFEPERLLYYLWGTGTIPAAAGLLLCCIGAAVYAVKTKKALPPTEASASTDAERDSSAGTTELRRLTVKYGLLLLSMLFLFVGYACALGSLVRPRPESFLFIIATHELPLLLVVPIWYLLCDRKDKRILMMVLFSLAYSLCVDISSDWVVGMGGKIAVVPDILLLQILYEEHKKDRLLFSARSAVNKSASIVICCCCMAGFAVWNIGFLHALDVFPLEEKVLFGDWSQSLTEEITSGPSKGLKTTKPIAETYNKALADLDYIRENGNDAQPVMIGGLFAHGYLYLENMPCASTTAFFKNELGRIDDYWAMFPEKTPVWVYLPYFDPSAAFAPLDEEEQDELLRFFEERGPYEITEGRAGYILLAQNADDAQS